MKGFLNREVKAIIAGYRCLVLGHENIDFLQILEGANSENMLRISQVNSVRPLFFSTLQKVGYTGSIMPKLHHYSLLSAIREKAYETEIYRLTELLGTKSVVATPYKGILFTNIIYGGKALRESSDMDLVLRKKDDLNLALQILINDGYEFLENVEFSNLYYDAPGNEISMVKYTVNGFSYALDLHWNICENYHVYSISVEDIFTTTINGLNQLPNLKSIFNMLLIHHGARGCWLKLKEIFDFVTFLNLYPNLDFHLWAKDLGMEKIFTVALELKNIVETGNDDNCTRIAKNIMLFWGCTTNHDGSFKMKMRKFCIYLALQQDMSSRLTLIYRYFLYHGTNTPLYEKYPKPLGGRFRTLNAVAKFSTIIIRSFKGAYK